LQSIDQDSEGELPLIVHKWLPYALVHFIVNNWTKSIKVIVARKLNHNYFTNTFGDIAIFESLVGTWTSVVNLHFKVFSYGRITTMCKGVIYCEAICYNDKLGVIAYNVQKGAWDDAIHEVPHDNYGDYQVNDIVQCKGYILDSCWVRLWRTCYMYLCIQAWTWSSNYNFHTSNFKTCPLTTAIIAKFLYDHILIEFGCPLTIVIDQGTHFINDVIHYLINHFILRHILVLLFIIHKGMDKLSLLIKFLVHCSRN